MPNSCTEESATAKFSAPTVTVAPQAEHMGNADKSIIEETIGHNNDNEIELITCEDDNIADLELHCKEDIEDASVAESIVEFNLHHQIP